jgi:hypothetical protein
VWPDDRVRMPSARRWEDIELERRSWAARQAPLGWRDAPTVPPAFWTGMLWALLFFGVVAAAVLFLMLR